MIPKISRILHTCWWCRGGPFPKFHFTHTDRKEVLRTSGGELSSPSTFKGVQKKKLRDRELKPLFEAFGTPLKVLAWFNQHAELVEFQSSSNCVRKIRKNTRCNQKHPGYTTRNGTPFLISHVTMQFSPLITSDPNQQKKNTNPSETCLGKKTLNDLNPNNNTLFRAKNSTKNPYHWNKQNHPGIKMLWFFRWFHQNHDTWMRKKMVLFRQLVVEDVLYR